APGAPISSACSTMAQFSRKAVLMDSTQPNFFAGPYVDRRADGREEAGWPAAALSDPETLFIVARDTAQLVYTGPGPRIAFVTREHPALPEPDPHSLLLLGWYKGARCVLFELGDAQPFEQPAGTSFEELRPLSPLL